MLLLHHRYKRRVAACKSLLRHKADARIHRNRARIKRCHR